MLWFAVVLETADERLAEKVGRMAKAYAQKAFGQDLCLELVHSPAPQIQGLMPWDSGKNLNKFNVRTDREMSNNSHLNQSVEAAF